MNGDYWHNFLFPKIMKFGEELNVDIAKPRQQHVILLPHLIARFVPAAHVTDEEVAKVLLTKYQSLCPSTSPLKLEREINRWRHMWADINDKPQTAISALNNTESFPNIRNVLLLFVTLPITFCDPERVFSKVQMTKTAIRSTMGTERLEALVIIPAHRSTLPSHQDIINTFCVKPRRLYFGNS